MKDLVKARNARIKINPKAEELPQMYATALSLDSLHQQQRGPIVPGLPLVPIMPGLPFVPLIAASVVGSVAVFDYYFEPSP